MSEHNDRIICALDLTDPQEARQLVADLDGLVHFFKVGMLLHLIDGRDMVNWLLERGKRVFLDLKFYDVPDTVTRVVEYAAASGVHFLTVHGNRDILEAAGRAAAGTGLRILAVTALTSLDQSDILALGYPCSLDELVLSRARWALDSGCAGVIASPREASLLRERCGPELLIVTPGIRPGGADPGTHKRAATPAEALRAGADYLVIGQPITKAPDSRAAAAAILTELAGVGLEGADDK